MWAKGRVKLASEPKGKRFGLFDAKGRVVDIKADYTGFTIPDAFVVGYGLDYAQKYRNLPYVGVLHFEE